MILLAMSRWQPNRIDRHHRALDRHHVEQYRDGRDLVGFLVHLTWPSTMRCLRREGGDYVDRLFRALALIGAPRSLAVDRDDLGRRVGQGRDPGHEASLERARGSVNVSAPRKNSQKNQKKDFRQRIIHLAGLAMIRQLT